MRQVKAIGCACIAVALSACAVPGGNAEERLQSMSRQIVANYAQSNAVYLQRNSEQDLTLASLDVMRNQLKDPASAQFRRVRVVTVPAGKLVCGDVNGKNAYGGYVGYRAFAASISGGLTQYTVSKNAWVDDAMNAGLFENCGR